MIENLTKYISYIRFIAIGNLKSIYKKINKYIHICKYPFISFFTFYIIIHIIYLHDISKLFKYINHKIPSDFQLSKYKQNEFQISIRSDHSLEKNLLI